MKNRALLSMMKQLQYDLRNLQLPCKRDSLLVLKPDSPVMLKAQPH